MAGVLPLGNTRCCFLPPVQLRFHPVPPLISVYAAPAVNSGGSAHLERATRSREVESAACTARRSGRAAHRQRCRPRQAVSRQLPSAWILYKRLSALLSRRRAQITAICRCRSALIRVLAAQSRTRKHSGSRGVRPRPRPAAMAATAPRAPLVALPLAPRARQQLLSAGYATAADLEHLTPENLAAGAAPHSPGVALAAARTACAPPPRHARFAAATVMKT